MGFIDAQAWEYDPIVVVISLIVVYFIGYFVCSRLFRIFKRLLGPKKGARALKSVLLAIILALFISAPIAAFGQSSSLAQSFSQYFSPEIFEKMDNLMNGRYGCKDNSYWKIWSYAFYKSYKKCNGPKDITVILNWDGYFYFDHEDYVKQGKWTELK